MLKSLKVKNFRAFRSQDFEFSKINIFVGANSTGKSSAISAINLIAQTVRRQDIQDSPLVLNGPYEQLGTFIDVVYGNRSNTPVSFDFSYGDDERTYQVSVDFKYRKIRRQIELLKFEYFFNGSKVYDYRIKKDGFDIRLSGELFENVMPGIQKRRPTFAGLFSYDFNIARPYMLGEKLSRLDKSQSALVAHVDRLVRNGRSALRGTFAGFDSLSPFRDQPQRTYLFTGEAARLIGRTGSNGVSILVDDVSRRGKLKDALIDKISHWLQVSGIGKSLALRPLTERHFEIGIMDLDGRFHNLCDVGFGVSQALPVLIGALNTFREPSMSAPIFVVQEPEIHLHPNAQATLGSFFVSIARAKGQLFIETHSDNLILRIANHIVEGHLPADDVTVFFFENTAEGKKVIPYKFNERGAFVPSWPNGFFPQREAEIMRITRSRRQRDLGVQEDSLSDFLFPEDGGRNV